MAAATSCFALSCKPKSFSLQSNTSTGSARTNSGRVCSLRSPQPDRVLAFSFSLSFTAFPKGRAFLDVVERASAAPPRRSVVCEAAPKKKADSAAKRARQAEKRRIYNKSRKSEIKTRMKKVLEELDVLKKKSEPQAEEILPVEKLIAEAYSAIDKAVKVGTLHRNTGARRKSRLARRKKAVEIHHGWYTPAPTIAAAA